MKPSLNTIQPQAVLGRAGRSLGLGLLIVAATGCVARSGITSASSPATPTGASATGPASYAGAFVAPSVAPSPAAFGRWAGGARPVNVAALLRARARSACPPEEVSPGNWVGFDCTPPLPVLRISGLRWASATNDRTGRFGLDDVSSLPAEVDHRASGTEGVVKNQGAVGTCTAVSLSSAMDHALRQAGVVETVSAIHLWSKYRVPSMGAANDAATDHRITNEGTWPYDPAEACKLMQRVDSCGAAYDVQPNSADADPELRAKQRRADEAGRFQLVGLERVADPRPSGLAALLAEGHDLWVALKMNRKAWNFSSVADGRIPDYSATDGSGHAVVLAGYRARGASRDFPVHNSWGTGWGDGGYAWISEENVRRHMYYAYVARMQPAGGSAPTPPNGNEQPNAPSPSLLPWLPPGLLPGLPEPAEWCVPTPAGCLRPAIPAPTGGGTCSAGQAPDLLTGKCTAMCPGNTPAIGGMCVPILP